MSMIRYYLLQIIFPAVFSVLSIFFLQFTMLIIIIIIIVISKNNLVFIMSILLYNKADLEAWAMSDWHPRNAR